MGDKKLLIIDSNALLHRSFHALPALTTKKGEQTGAVYGFLLTLFKAIKDLSPKYIVACFDTAVPTFRQEEFKEYKAQRPKTPEEIVSQIPIAKDVLKALNIPVFTKDGFEADDLIATIAKKQLKEELEIYILTGDLDNLQLVNKNTRVYTLGRGIKDTVIYDENKVLERFAINPSQMVDFKALVGDPSDNIPGVLGIGKKTAADLLKKFGTLEKIYQSAESKDSDIKPKIKEILLKNREEAFLARKLVKMKEDVVLDFNIKECEFGNFAKDKIEKIFSKLEFYSLINRIPYQKTSPVKPTPKLLI